MAQLHIVNGEGTAVNFRRSGIPGDLVVWNEALVMGPVTFDIGTAAFWKLRSTYFLNQQNKLLPSANHPTYEQLVVAEFDKLKSLSSYQQITLWFEHDLFCQINMMGLLAWISSQLKSEVSLMLVCIDRFPGIEDFRGLGQLHSKDYPTLLDQAQLLSRNDLDFAQSIWTWYCSNEPHVAVTSTVPAIFPFWDKAQLLHWSRFPSVKNGLSALQQIILELVADHEPTKRSLMRELLINQGAWGFGDFQYLEMIHDLHVALNVNSTLTLSKIGLQLLSGEANYLHHSSTTNYLGGAGHRDFRWNGTKLIIDTK